MSHLHLSWGMRVALRGAVGRDLQGTWDGGSLPQPCISLSLSFSAPSVTDEGPLLSTLACLCEALGSFLPIPDTKSVR